VLAEVAGPIGQERNYNREFQSHKRLEEALLFARILGDCNVFGKSGTSFGAKIACFQALI
jgi:hypothetical protein